MGQKSKVKLFWATMATGALVFAGRYIHNQQERHPAGLFQAEKELPTQAQSSMQKELELKYGIGTGLRNRINILKTQSGTILFNLQDKKAVFVSEKKLLAEQIDFESVSQKENLKNSKELTLEDYYKNLDERVLAIKYSNPALYATNLNGRVAQLKNQIQSEFLRNLQKEKEEAAAKVAVDPSQPFEVETSPTTVPALAPAAPAATAQPFSDKAVLPPPVHIRNK